MQNTKLFLILALATFLSGCPLDGDDGANGQTGATGPAGVTGPAGPTGLTGINCWDLNGDRVNDQNEDVNLDGSWDSADCNGSSTSAAQSAEADLNHQHICEALANLGQYPIGCPSNTHTVPTGTLTKMTETTFFDDGMDGYTSCNNVPNDGLLSIKTRDFVNSSGDTVDQSWFELEGGYVAAEETMSRSDVNADVCQNRCQSDSNCIAAVALSKTDFASTCTLFYHSDTVSKYERVCGLDIPGTISARDLCLQALAFNAVWYSKCP